VQVTPDNDYRITALNYSTLHYYTVVQGDTDYDYLVTALNDPNL
jgi:hypothetical protein